MATKNDPSLPLTNGDDRKTSSLLPRYYRTDSNKKFLSATLDQLTQPGAVKKVTGYIGRQNAKAVKASDVFISATDSDRQNYQLEPAAVIEDFLGNVNFYKDYIDHVNHVKIENGIVSNHERLNTQEFYSWNPHICWDKFVNFQQYYWLPYGPDPIEVLGQQQEIESTYSVVAVDEGDNWAFVFSPDGLTRNPTLTLYRGQTYNFSINTPGIPFSIKTVRTPGQLDRWTEGVSSNGIQNGTITFKVPEKCPDVLFYVSEADANTGGVLEVKDIDENAFLDVDADVLGKKTYTMSNGIPMTNGMKLFFSGKVVPAQYETGYWYVEGVGSAIKLISEADLEIISAYSQEKALFFDNEPFDREPFSTLTSFPKDKDYVVINRASPDRSPWSRYNRWFHQDVVIATAKILGVVADLDQAQRATRPIIEFEAGLKLFNFGHKAKVNVDVIDNFTADVFSTIEGSLGYNIDGVDLSDGMRVLFTADQDRYVKDKIFKVNFITVTAPGRQIEFNGATGVDIASDIITCSAPHGLTTGNQVVYLNNGNDNLAGLTNRKIYYVLIISDTQLRLFTDKLLITRAGIFAVGTNQHKLESFSGLRRQINLVEDIDTIPLENQTVLVKLGNNSQGKTYWYNGATWKLGQLKTKINQQPLFDIFDDQGISYGNISVYDGSNFSGTKVFSYKVGTGIVDTALGFPLSYKNINNTGDIVFNFDLLKDSFNYKVLTSVLSKSTNIGFLKVIIDRDIFSYQNGWTKNNLETTQPIVRTFKETEIVNNFPIDVYDFKDQLDDLQVKVYINGLRQNRETFSVVSGPIRKEVVLSKDILPDNVVTLKCYAKQAKNNNGYYEIPLSLQNNPLNNNVDEFTLGQVIDHVDSIVENLNNFSGTFPGYCNLRDLGNITPYGTRFVQHSGPLNLSLYHLGSRNANVLRGLKQARLDYGKFKRAFLTFASESGIDTDPRPHVDFILQEISKNKTKTQPYYLSDMFAYLGANRLEYTVLDSRIKTYPLTSKFNLDNLSNRSVNIYVNEQQLVHGREYVFGDDIFFEILIDLQEGDLIEAFEYETTDGAFCPATPTKLGLYPAYEPKIYIDNSYLTPTKVIQGHDGSITVAFNDYRDDLLLELEKRIFNNIKVKYDSSIFDIWNFIPGYNRETAYSKEEFDLILGQFFFEWTVNIPQDYTKQDNQLWSRLNPFTWNYRGNTFPNQSATPAFWRGIYRWTLDTDRPDTHPWEALGFTIEPTWWKTVYGPAPYTSNNFILWSDIEQGLIREPGKPVQTVPKFAKSILAKGKPVDENGNLIDPYNAEHVSGYINPTPEGFYVFGDCGPVESAWRRSSYYPFALLNAALLMQPNLVLGTCLDRSRIVRNLDNQLVYKDTGLRIRLADIKIPSTALSSTRIFTSGLINYVVDYITSDTTLLVTQYAEDLVALTNKIGAKLGGFTSKEKFRLLLDSKSVSSSGGVFVPEENYKIFANISSPIKKISYSGVVITKYPDGYEVRGYSVDQPYFTYHPYTLPGRVINIGGISESFVVWTPDRYYAVGKIVRANNQYYRVKLAHQSSDTFNETNFTRVSDLPINGGRSAELRKAFNLDTELQVGYGTKFSTIQEAVDFLQGYGAYLQNQGFIFDDFNTTLKNVNNWESAIKEFLFWTTQNWGDGAVLSLSPAATNLLLQANSAVVNDITDQFYEYKVFRVDGQKLDSDFTNTFRENNQFSLSPYKTNHGVYGASLYLVQKEHILLLDNETLFNDVIYDQEPGYRQERVKVIGYLSTNWNGGYNIPGFIYDQAKLTLWAPWTDYNLGDIVKYKEFYYSASKFLPGTEEFENINWIKLEEKPESRLLPNWEYKTMQFTDFYSLDSDNFDVGQQKMAQHLIGYQKRQYLENIIQDDVSQYKFYQGMIIEKGTQNVLNKLFDVLSADDQESLTFNEEWAIRVGNYGASESFNEIEFILDESKFKLNPQPIELVSTIDPTVVDFVYRQLPTDVYVKPVSYNNNPWSSDGTTSYLRTPGYVRYDDVTLNVDTLDDVVGKNISNFKDSDYVWCAFENRDWNIYRLTKALFKVIGLTYSSNLLSIECDRITSLSIGDIVGLSNAPSVQGFYKIVDIENRTLVVAADIPNWAEPFTELDQIVSYQFYTARASSIDEVNNILPRVVKENDQVWADDNGTGKYTVYKNNKVFRQNTLDVFAPATDLNFGRHVCLAPNGNVAVVSTSANIVNVYTKTPVSNLWVFSSRILPNLSNASTSNLNFGDELTFSPDGQWLAISAPTASDVNDSNLSQQGYVAIYNRATRNTLEFADIVVSQSPAEDEKFGSKTVFGIIGNTYVLAVSAPGANKVYFYRYNGTDWVPYGSPVVGPALSQFGTDLDMSENASRLVVGAPYSNDTGAVYVYDLENDVYVLNYTLDSDFLEIDSPIGDDDQFGVTVSISNDGQYIVAGAPYSDSLDLNSGKVLVFKGSECELHQVIFSNSRENFEKFGMSVVFLNDSRSVAIFSANGDVTRLATVDKYSSLLTNSVELYGTVYINDPLSTEQESPTTFDNDSFRIVDVQVDAGRVDVYDRYHTKLVYGESLDTSISNDSTDAYGFSFAAAKNSIIVGAPRESQGTTNNHQGAVYSYSRLPNSTSWTILHQESPRPNAYRIKKAYIYDRTQNELTSYIDVVDPIQGKIPGPADQEISFKSYFDPATYSVGNATVNVDDGINWTKDQVGMLWWDLTRAKFLDNQCGGTVYRSTTWNRLYETASIDIYEWVESKYLPSQWDELATTDAGDALGITGTTRYGDAVYSIKKRYDQVSKTFANTYYYWVKNPTVVPNKLGRSLSASNVSKLIADPISENYTCLALTGTNSFSLVNVANLINSANYNLTVQYWMVDIVQTTNNAHSQWKIVSEHPNTIIPIEIEKKWLDSLIGKDDNDRVIPDIKLPFKQRYGIGFRPRQSMFVNRVEALKQFIERVNSVLAKKLIADDYDLSALQQFNSPPSAKSGVWDVIIDTDAELRFVGTATVDTAILLPIIINGRIVGVEIVNSGNGYVNAPSVLVSNTGKNAALRTRINDQGQIIGVDISNQGEGYLDSTTLSVRPFTVLVSSDSNSFSKWSTYVWNASNLSWDRVQGQSFDVTLYWNYIDWYQSGYNQFTKIDHIVDNTYQLATLTSELGDVVKVKNVGTGGWLLLEKYNNSATIDYTENFSVIGRNNGTIQFADSLYNYVNTGYDSALFDSRIYDNLAEIELRIIIDTIKEQLLVDELRVEYLKLFFASLRYALHEQTFIDWAFKTSFVKATHNVGSLKQKVNYNSDNLENFEDYIKEVKPYRTQIREFVSSYTKVDSAATSVTDFDLIPTISSTFEVTPVTASIDSNGEIDTVYEEMQRYPWKHWYDNVGFKVISIELVDGGSGYIDNPVVKIEGGFGSGATAKAYVTNGRVNRLQLITSGSGYLKAPTITIEGGLKVDGVPARAALVIESEVVRSNKITVKFDRITRNYFVTEINETETFVGTGSRLQFSLKWSPDSAIGNSSVLVNGVDVLRDDYSLTSKKSSDRGYSSYSGLLTLDSPPASGAVIEITYKKNFNHLSATDRINFYYNPETGQYGKDLAQLMTGIDYGGVSVTGLGFNISGGWDSLPWFTDSWDGFDATFDDYIVIVSDETYEFTLPYAPILNERINVYLNGTRLDDPYFNLYDGITVQPNGRKLPPIGTVMTTIIGDGITKTFTLPDEDLSILEGDKVIFRKQSSDGSFSPLPTEYDTQLTGGDLAYVTATGIAPDDIILDGDGLVTPMSSAAPEEIVPGQIVDTVAIKVYQLPTSASAKISFMNYIANGATVEFKLGQIPNNFASIIVKVNDNILKRGTDYTVNWQSQNVVFNTPPGAKTIVTVIVFGAASEAMVDTNYFVSDGDTLEYVTDAAYFEGLGTVVLVNGLALSYEIFRTSEAYDSPEKVGIRFGSAPTAGAIISYVITGDANQSASIIKSEQLAVDGVENTFTLINSIGNSQPLSNNVLVIVDGRILQPSTTEYFTLANENLTYTLSSFKSQPYIADPIDYKIYLDGVELNYGADYIFDVSVMSVELRDRVYIEGALLAVVSFADAEYIINDTEITFTDTPALTSVVEIMSFYNHDILQVLRTAESTLLSGSIVNGSYDYFRYNDIAGGKIKLNRTVAFDDYIWVIKNNQMLTHSVDYYLESDLVSVKLKTPLVNTDVVDVVCFADRVVNQSYGYMIFKDMLNRVHYKRISKAKSTRLARDLRPFDVTITVVDGAALSPPNPAANLPGIIEVNGERIEYFTKVDNVLGQLRRGTLGTGVPELHRIRTVVLDIGHTETIPYQDRHIVETTISNGINRNINLNYVPENKDAIDVFVGGYRLKKNNYSLFEESNGYPYSPEGDSAYAAEFTVDGDLNQVVIDNNVALTENEKIVVIKKIGKVWTPDDADLTYVDNEIANFIKNTEAVFSQYLVDKYQYVLASDEGITLLTDDDEPLELD
jgi:hypothetical protein